MSYKTRLGRDLDHWIGQGWVDAAHRDDILADAARRSTSWSTTGALAILGAALLAMSALTFVAANWDAMPRLIRFGLLVSALLVSMLAAGRALDRGAPALGHALAILGVALFGAAIMLTAQTFNMTSFRNTAVLIWALAGLVTALAIPSRPVLILATLLGALWAGLEIFNPLFDGVVWLYLPLWLATFALASRLGSRVALNLLALGLGLWVTHLVYQYEARVLASLASHAGTCLVFGAVALAFAVLRDRKITGGGIVSAWFAVATVFLTLALQFHLDGDSIRDDAVSPTAYLALAGPAFAAILGLAMWRRLSGQAGNAATAGFLGAGLIVLLIPWLTPAFTPADGVSLLLRVTLGALFYAGSVALILQGNRDGARASGAIGICAFIAQTLYVYAETFGDLLDTAFFFLLGGLLLFALSYGLFRWRRRQPADAPASEGDAS